MALESIGPRYWPPRLPGKGWVLVAAGGFKLEPRRRYELAVRGGGLVDDPEYISAVCDGPRSFAGIDWTAVLAFRPSATPR